MKFRKSGGFALPSVLISSLIMMSVLIVSVAATSALRASMSDQYYNELAKSASRSGVAYAQACLEENAGAVTWSDDLPLAPNTDCRGAQLPGVACDENSIDPKCSVYIKENIRSTFSVGLPTLDVGGAVSKVTAIGKTKLLRKSNATAWRQYTQTSQLSISNPTQSTLASADGLGGSWAYQRSISISNTNTDTMRDYQVQVQPFVDPSFLDNSGLVGSWHFNESSAVANTTAYDMSGNGNHGVMSGTNYRSDVGRFGRAFLGDGATNNRVSIPFSYSINPTTSLSIEAWFKFTSSGVKEMISRMNADGTGPLSYELFQSNQRLTFRLFKSGANDFTTNTDLSLGAWHHVVATWDGTTVKIYVDGVLDMTPGTLASPIDPSAYGLSIGGYGNGTYLFNGMIDEVKIFNRALTGPSSNCMVDRFNEVCNRYGVSGVPKLRSDYADIRFTDSTGSIQYPFWQETDNKFWVKIPSLNNGNSTINMYYGNPNAKSASNGNDTFAFFDDFRSANIDTAKWAEIDVGNKLTQVNGSLNLTAGASAWDSALISKTNFNRYVGYTVTGNFKAGASVASPNNLLIGWSANQEALADSNQLQHGLYFNSGVLSNVYENGTAYPASGTAYAANSNHLFNIQLKATGAKYENNSTLIYANAGGSLTNSPMRVGIHQYEHLGNIYYIFVRQSSPVVPIISAPYGESRLSKFITL